MKPGLLHGYTPSPSGLYRKVVHFPWSAFGRSKVGWTAKVLVRNSTGKLIKVEKAKI